MDEQKRFNDLLALVAPPAPIALQTYSAPPGARISIHVRRRKVANTSLKQSGASLLKKASSAPKRPQSD